MTEDQNKTNEERITDLYNHHAELYAKAEETMDHSGLSFHGFVCNALTLAVSRSSRQELRAHFEKYARP